MGISYSKYFVTFLERTDRKKALQETYHMKTDTKQRREYKQDALEKRLVYEITQQNMSWVFVWILAMTRRREQAR